MWVPQAAEVMRRGGVLLSAAHRAELQQMHQQDVGLANKSKEELTFIALIRGCAKHKNIHEGSRLHAEILKRRLLGQSPHLASSLINMYAKCGVISKAHQVLEELTVRNVVSWSALIAGYAQLGQGHEALHCFELMQNEGLSPDAITFTSALKACGSIRDLNKGEKMHNEIMSRGLLDNDIMLGSALVDMYAKCHANAKARWVLEELPFRNVVSWNALITGYVQQSQWHEALNCFHQMQNEGLSPNVVTFTSILNACGNMGAIDKGKQIHEDIMNRGLIENDMVLGNALVDMYVKCGVLAKAQKVLEELPVRNVVSWSALVAGYALQGQGHEALNCFGRMQNEGLCPNAVTFICVLKACSSIGAIGKGIQIHEEIVSRGLVEKDPLLGNALVDMYAKCGMPSKAQKLLQDLPIQDVELWSTLMVGYIKQGQCHEAFNCFEQMQRDGLSPNASTYVCILKACTCMQAIDKGKQIHDEIMSNGLLEKDVVLGTALVDMYAKCGMLTKAAEVLDNLPIQDVVTWSALIAGYTQHGQSHEALNCFERMKTEGHSPDEVTFVSILKACSSTGAIEKGQEIHDEIVNRGMLEQNLMLGTALIDMYAKCGVLTRAQRVLEELPYRDVVSWAAVIVGYAQQGQTEEALNCFKQMQNEGLSTDMITFISILKACGKTGAVDKGRQIHIEIACRGFLEKDTMVSTALVNMYARCGELGIAQQVLEELPFQDVGSWAAVIAGYVQKGQGHEALKCFEQMKCRGLSPDMITLIAILKACIITGATEKGRLIHDDIVNRGLLEKDVLLGNALVNVYVNCGLLSKAQKALKELPIRNLTSWSALIAGYVQHGQVHEALYYYDCMKSEGFVPDVVTFICILKACGSLRDIDKGKEIHEEIQSRCLVQNDIILGNVLVDMYAKCGVLAKAQQVLEDLPCRDVVSWNALITGYAQQGQCHEAFDCFTQMKTEGLSPSAVTFTCILKACGDAGAIDKGEHIREEIVNLGLLESDVMLGTALVDMYAKCGMLVKARQVLKELPIRDTISWNALISGYALHRQGQEALSCFQEMQSEGFHPNDITFLCLLSACSHSGLLDVAQKLFGNMAKNYGITPNLEHHTCMVVVFGCLGHFDKAMSLIKVMPSCCYRPVWVALLAACRKWGNVKLGRLAFDQAVQVDDSCAASYILMSSIFAAAGLQEDAKRVEAMRAKYAAWRHPKNSLWVDASGNVHSFLLGIGNILKEKTSNHIS